MKMKIEINGLDIKDAYAGVRVTNKDGLSIRITNTQVKNGFELFCDRRMPDGALLQEGKVFYIINGEVSS